MIGFFEWADHEMPIYAKRIIDQLTVTELEKLVENHFVQIRLLLELYDIKDMNFIVKMYPAAIVFVIFILFFFVSGNNKT